MNDNNFQTVLTTNSKFNNFQIRRTLERLREGLFDSFGVQLLTTSEKRLNQIFNQTFITNYEPDLTLNPNLAQNIKDTTKKPDKAKPAHLCVCGAYGQGKSHTLNYIEQQALNQNFVVSYINLDPVQVCFHNFNIVYRSLMENLSFPDQQTQTSFAKIWKIQAKKWLALQENRNKTLKNLIPETIPHKFQCILTAMAQNNMAINLKKRKLKKHVRFQPGSFPWILKNALLGKNIPAWRLSSVFKYRNVDFYKDKSLVCKKPEDYLDMVHGMGKLFKKIGYRGWIVLFDEGESIVQNNIICRTKSYKLLDQMFYPDTRQDGLFPVFAFTNDFFAQLEYEDYERIKPKRNYKNRDNNHLDNQNQNFYFDKNYHDEWKNIQKLRLHGLSSKEWETLIQRLVIIHGLAYNWEPTMDLMQNKINQELLKYATAETRLKFKITINILDMEQQKLQFA
jgi:hypothetical protein